MAIRTLTGKSTEKVQPKTTTTTGGTETTTRIKGGKSLTPEQMADFRENYEKPLQQLYEIDPNTGKNVSDVGALLGFDPEEYQREEEAKQRAAAFKRKEAGWANALKVVSEIAAAAHGGNVYRNDLANVGKEATQQEEASKVNIRKMGQAVAQARQGKELAFAKERQAALKNYYDRYGVQTDTTTKTITPKVSITTGGDKEINSNRQVLDNSRNNGNGGNSRSSGYIMNFRTKDGKAEGINISNKEASAVIGLLKAHYTKLLNDNNTKLADQYLKLLTNEHIIKSIDAEGNIDFDENQLLRSGVYFGLDQGLRDRIVKATNGKAKFTTPEGWGTIETEEEYDF